MRPFTWIYTLGMALIVVNSVRRSVSGESTDLGRLRVDFHQTNPTRLWTPVSTTKITAVTIPVWSAHPVFAIHTNIVSAVTASTPTSVPIATMSDFAPIFLNTIISKVHNAIAGLSHGYDERTVLFQFEFARVCVADAETVTEH